MKAYGIGRLTANIDLKKTSTGRSTTSFTLACGKPNKKQLEQEGKPTADFIKCVAWQKTAELLAQYTGKGSELFVEGEITTRSYKDTDGKTVYVTEVNVNEVRFLSNAQRNAQPEQVQEAPLEITADYLPF